MKKHFILLALVIFSSRAFAQNTPISTVLTWKKITLPALSEGKAGLETEGFDGADFSFRTKGLPWFGTTFSVSNYGDLNVQIVNARYESLTLFSDIDLSLIGENLNIESRVDINRRNFQGVVRFIPIIKTAAGLQKLVAFDLKTTVIAKALPTSGLRGGPKTSSVLKDGSIFKIAVENTGIQKIDAKLLKELGIDITKIDPKKLKIYGNGSGVLPELVSAFREDDLAECPIVVLGEEDGKFNDADQIFFYGVGPDRWDYNKTAKLFQLEKNVYSFTSNYFIKIDGEDGKRITEKSSLANGVYTSTTFNDFLHYEKESINLLGAFNYTTGSGRDWYGEKLTLNKSSISINNLNIPNVDASEKAFIKAWMAVRSARNLTFDLTVQNNNYEESTSAVNLAETEYAYANVAAVEKYFSPKGENFNTTVGISAAGNDFEAWLDFIEINARRQLSMTGSQMAFRDIKTLDYPTSTFQVKNANNIDIWNVTNPTAPFRQQITNNNGTLSFSAATQDLQQYIAFNSAASDLNIPKAAGKVDNQNLHSITKADMIIIYPKEFQAEAERLAEHRKKFNKLDVKLVLLDHIYNEFSSGAMDVTAIRDFAKMVHDRDDKFQYLLLLGDGSFNHRGIGVEANKNLNWIPVYETKQSLSYIAAFPSDDYYGLLSPTEGIHLQGSLDIAVGRITAQDIEQLRNIITKIIHYDSNAEAMRDFRNRIVFVADDYEESWEGAFLEHSEASLWKEETQKVSPIFNGEKIYLDSYTQITTPGGQRSPDCQEAINNNMFKGNLVINYVGHGGPRGWTQERILNANEDVPTWSNFERLPLMITATCSFGGYDNPNNFTAGEQALALDKGGAVGLFATVRSVYQGANEVLTRSVFNEMYKKNGYNARAMGEILRQAKNNSGTDTENNRKFAMLGDPSQRLMIPQYNVSTTAINGKSVKNTNLIDTVGALNRVEIEGVVTDSLGNTLDWFTGTVYPTIFDKELTLKTILSGKNASQSFKTQNRILFKGSTSVRNGKFKFSCVIPKDIDYTLGFAKISYYATNDAVDAAGYDNKHLVIGGTGINPVKDEKPPLVEVFMDNEDFKVGGMTSQSPTLLVRLTDDTGFNISGSSVGHDMKAVLDDNTQNTYRLNDFYEAAKVDSDKNNENVKGKVKYPLAKLKDGTHKISVKAWDLANNPGEGATEFVVASNGKGALEQVLNYPNPFTTKTNFQFRHHLAEINVKVQVRIFTVSGRLVKTIFADATTEDGRVTDVVWDGKDDFEEDLAKGVYLYKIHIQSPRNATINEESEFEKLVILK